LNQVYFKFHDELNDFLPCDKRKDHLLYAFVGTPSVKHLIEAAGIPHTEVRHILVNGAPVDFSYLVQESDRIQVYPASQPLSGILPLNEPDWQSYEKRFILDNHLGRLAAYLRMLDIDTLYSNNYQDDEIARLCESDQRILLTRDRRLLMRKAIRYGYWVRQKKPRQQIVEIITRYQLEGLIKPFHRCLRCNGLLRQVNKASILDRLEPLTKKYYEEFHICSECGQIYWQGTHYERMKQLIQLIVSP
jgi:uncharacterized protein with PIN domain